MAYDQRLLPAPLTKEGRIKTALSCHSLSSSTLSEDRFGAPELDFSWFSDMRLSITFYVR